MVKVETEQTQALPEGDDVLEAIEREAAAIEGAAQAQAAPLPPAQTNTAAELRGALDMVRVMAAPAFADWPDFGTVWGDRTLEGIAQSGGAIMDRHGWTMGEFLGQWGPYIGLFAAVGPAGLATYQHLKIKRLKAEAEARERASRERPQQAGN